MVGSKVSLVFPNFPIWFAGVSFELENIWGRSDLDGTGMFQSQFPEPICIGLGAESLGPVDGSPMFLSFSGVTQGNWAVTGLLSFDLLQKLAALVHRSGIVPGQSFDPNLTCQPLRQFQR